MVEVRVCNCFGRIDSIETQALDQAPPAVHESQEARGDFAAIACAEAIRRKKIVPPDDVLRYFAAHPSA